MKRSTQLLGLAASALLIGAAVLSASTNDSGTVSAQRSAVRVHGLWTLKVRTRAGRLVSQRRFENTLTSPGALAQILAREKSPGFWAIALNAAVDKPCVSNGVPYGCAIREPGDGSPNSIQSNNLVVSYDTNAQATVLSGSINASRTGQVEFVSTQLFLCDPTNPPSSPCLLGSPPQITSKQLIPPVDVQSGQQVSATVQITFS
jgi:hypothetical protein